MTTPRKHPIVRAQCKRCGLRLVGEMRADGWIYPSRHPYKADRDIENVLCADCYEATHPPQNASPQPARGRRSPAGEPEGEGQG